MLGRIGKAIPSILGASIIFVAEVGPKDAELNLCNWLRLQFPGIQERCLNGISGSLIYALAAVLIVSGVVWVFWPQLVGKFSKVRSRKARICGGQYVPLYEAARRALDSNTSLAAIVRGVESNRSEAIITWYCYYLQKKSVIYGYRPPSTNIEQFAQPNYDFRIEDGIVIATERSGHGRWEHLEILERDLLAAIEAINMEFPIA
ncbi:MAG TPA: hypothetical protein VGP28_06340 [Methylocella sp.]|nr:hypothetical protein [Methylocella sp.]